MRARGIPGIHFDTEDERFEPDRDLLDYRVDLDEVLERLADRLALMHRGASQLRRRRTGEADGPPAVQGAVRPALRMERGPEKKLHGDRPQIHHDGHSPRSR